MNFQILRSKNLTRDELNDSIAAIDCALSSSTGSIIERSHESKMIKRIGGSLLPNARTLTNFQRLGCSFSLRDQENLNQLGSFLKSSIDTYTKIKFRWEVKEGQLEEWKNLWLSFSCGTEKGNSYAGVYCGYWQGASSQDKLKFFKIAIGLGLSEMVEVCELDDGFRLHAKSGALIDFPISEIDNKNPSAFRIHGFRSLDEAENYCRRLLNLVESGVTEQSIEIVFDEFEHFAKSEVLLNQRIPNLHGQMIANVAMSPEEFMDGNGQNSVESMPILSAWLTQAGPELVLNLVATKEVLQLEIAVIGEENLQSFESFLHNSQELQNLSFAPFEISTQERVENAT